ncbi:LysR family transcriptional regulator [Mycobacterium intermedium]|uniref:Probable hydrogen peroxide-inducible genes activator n=1 Tax=Mycobacterium intermedium TaxID=28445 RepID=A0A1E3SB07_MYCIE|nr:LysR family transcriptional regulator [Mycobacterium intermedium]MCV6967498.1 LysR family transcriptional regulator [Mycobacterium intermedium]ODQ99346.1 LysR family transcriptional regulator [Mycobacterium intermedium]OPE49163.1 LysR family transcriptional regulator [Mycobacterium intermedium]ORB07809.1 LysR family transcriptional regulator [Mycobacterium intermedium]
MNLQQLRYAVALAETKSFTKAAEGQFVVQSALSQQVRRLEEELGVRLFERTTRTVTLTPAGESLMPLLHQVVAGVERIKFDAQALSGSVTGRLTVGMMEIPSESLDVAALMANFHLRYPDVSVTLRSGGSDVLVKAAAERKLDAAIVGSNVSRSHNNLIFTHLFSEPLVAVMPAEHPLTRHSSVSVTELAELSFIDFPPGYGLRHETDRGFADVPRRVAFEVTRVDEVVHFVRKDLGVALLPESVARTRADADPTLALRPVRGADMHRRVHLVTPRPDLRSAACQAFIGCVDEHLGRAPA